MSLCPVVKTIDPATTVMHPMRSIKQKAVTGSLSSRGLKKYTMMNKTTPAIKFAALYLTSFRKVSPKPGATLRSKIDFEQKVNIYINI